MNLVFVMEEAYSLHPGYLKFVVLKAQHETVGVVIVRDVSSKYNHDVYFQKNWKLLKFRERMKLEFRHAWVRWLDNKYKSTDRKNLYSVKSVVDHLGLDHIEVSGSVNTEETLGWVKTKDPDVIISCGQAIFGKRLLELPKKCCVNRHSSLLPSYGGVLAPFHAYRCGESFVGASIHTMEREIDAGVVLAQAKIPLVKREPMMVTYQKCFEVSRRITLEALNKIHRGDLSSVSPLPPKSYYSFPTEEEWREFRRRGGRII